MAASAVQLLHNYDLQLCDYLTTNLWEYRDDEPFARLLRQAVFPDTFLNYVLGDCDPDAEQEWLLFGEEELVDLVSTLKGLPHSRDYAWVPYVQLHRRYVNSVKGIREEMSRQVADDWSQDCVRYGKRLEVKGTTLLEGLKTLRGWLRHLRRLLRALGANDMLPQPEGSFPTPSAHLIKPTATGNAEGLSLEAPPEDDVREMKEAIMALGKEAKQLELIKHAHINRQRGLVALRWLQQLGEYQGFSKATALRYRQGK